jgi:hypothetical protein
MKSYFWTLSVFIILGCSSSKNITGEQKYTAFEVIKTPLKTESDPIFVSELRFYKIQSALDGMKLMYENYGEWNKKIVGKHQQNINRIIWENIKLLDEENEKFTVVADGKETKDGHFACIMVFDAEERDCFSSEHPLKEKLTALFTHKMSKIDKNSSVYKLFK